MADNYEELINNHKFFTVDKETDGSLYSTLRLQLMDLIVKYYQKKIYVGKGIEEYSLELTVAFNQCIKVYDKSKGEFTHLLNHIVKRNVAISKAKEKIENRRKGIHITESNDLLIRKIWAYANSKKLDIYSINVQEQLAQFLHISLKDVEELIKINNDAIAISDINNNEDGEEVSLFEMVPSKELTPEEFCIQRNNLMNIVNALDEKYRHIQNRPTTKRVISMMLTTRIIESIDDESLLKEILMDKSFINKDVILDYKYNKKLPRDKDIANCCDVSIQSLSRTYKNFIKSQ